VILGASRVPSSWPRGSSGGRKPFEGGEYGAVSVFVAIVALGSFLEKGES
jgi:hypothetical protein